MVVSSNLDVLHYYAGRGWPVFPVHSIRSDGACDCGNPSCRSPGKHPWTEHGFKNATLDLATIDHLWSEFPNANAGIPTGADSGIVVLDVDVKAAGDETLRDLQSEHGPLPDTVECLTGGGGRHLYFAHPGVHVPNGVGKLGSGLDIRGDGGFVCAPPSRHRSGRSYVWEVSSRPSKVQLAPMPGWLLALVVGSPNGKIKTADPLGETISDGKRNATLASLAGSMRRRGASQASIEAALASENAGRCRPPLADDEVHNIARSIATYTPLASGIGASSVTLGAPEIRVEGDDIIFVWHGQKRGIGFSRLLERADGLHGEISVTAINEAGVPGHLHWARLNLSSTTQRESLAKFLTKRTSDDTGRGASDEWLALVEYACTVAAQRHREGAPFVNLADLPRPPALSYLLSPLLPRGQTSVIYSKGASGKSLLTLAIAVAVQSGIPLPGGLVPGTKTNVLYLDYEADEEEQRLRLDYLCRGMGLDFIPPVRCRHQTRPLSADIGRLRAECARDQIGLVIVDSIAYAIGGNALDGEVVIQTFNDLRSLGKATTRLVIAHIPKSEKDAKQASIYGSVFQENAGRSVWELQSTEETDGISMALIQRKVNWGKKSPPFGFRLSFDDAGESVRLSHHDIGTDPELAGHTSLSYQILAILKRGRWTVSELTEETGAPRDSVRKTVLRLKQRGNIIEFPPQHGKKEPSHGLAMTGTNDAF